MQVQFTKLASLQPNSALRAQLAVGKKCVLTGQTETNSTKTSKMIY